MGKGDIAQLGERCVRNAKVAGSNPVVSRRKSRVCRITGGCGIFYFRERRPDGYGRTNPRRESIAKSSAAFYNKRVSSSGRSAAHGCIGGVRSHTDYPGNTLRLGTLFVSFFPMLFVRIITFHYITLTSIDLRATSWYILNRSEMTLVRQGSLPEAEPDLPPNRWILSQFSNFLVDSPCWFVI